jgi:Protein of unknown function (DUF2523)
MFGIVLSVFNTALAWIFRSVLVKFILYFALFFVTSEFIGLITNLIPDGSSINSTLAGIGASTWYFLDAFKVQTGLSLVVSAYATRFIIRRIPIIG